ncbi:MAG: nickel-responsive transcriptional regulator NikR [Phycisphaerae bacterium]
MGSAQSKSAEVVRFGVSMEPALLAALDRLVRQKGYANRSQAIRNLIRQQLVELEWRVGRCRTVAAVCLVYDHEVADLPDRLTHLQHRHTAEIVSSLHVHLDERNCLEVLVLRGRADRLRRIADHLITTRGVKYGKLMMATTGQEPAQSSPGSGRGQDGKQHPIS